MAINAYIKAGTTFSAAFYNFEDENLTAPGAFDKKLDIVDPVYTRAITAAGKRSAGEYKPSQAICKAVETLYFIHFPFRSKPDQSGYIVAKDGTVFTQYLNGNNDYVVCHIGKDVFNASVVDQYGGTRPYILQESKVNTGNKTLPDGVFFGILCYLMYSKDGGVPAHAQETYQDEFAALDAASDTDAVHVWYGALSEEVRMFLANENYGLIGFNFNVSNIVPNPTEVLSQEIEIETAAGGTDRIPMLNPIAAAAASLSLSDLPLKYHFERELTEEEKSLIPVLPETYVVPDKLIYALELISKSNRFRNFVLRGPAGTGKTEWCKCLASSLQLPYLFFGCSTDTEKMDLTMSIIPAESDEEFTLEGINPSEWILDPVMSYKNITGKTKEDATDSDCLSAVIAKASGKNGSAFKYVESNLIRAFRKGYVCEVQEPTIMSRPGVLASLNSMFDGCKAVTLVNGETVRRHPDAIVVYTTNTSYEGCVSLNQSALSRMVCIDLDDLSDDKIVERLMNNTGWNNEPCIRKMVKVYRACLEKAAQEAITDGSIDMRAMEDWVMACSITGPRTIYQNGMNMLISKCSNDPSLREEFISCLESQFKPTD